MSNDPYTPPSAPVRDRSPEPAGSTWKAVTFGVLADVCATFLGGIALFAIMGSFLVSQGASPEDLDASLAGSDLTQLLGVTLGLCCTVLGGYVTGRVARQREYYHALLTGIVVLLIGEIMVSTPSWPPTLIGQKRTEPRKTSRPDASTSTATKDKAAIGATPSRKR